MDYIILTFPRSGSNYLQQLIRQRLRDPNDLHTPIEIKKTHSVSEADGKKVISIARDPFHTMKSLVALALTFPDEHMAKSGETFKFPADEYMETYSYIIENSDLIIDYNDLVSRPDNVLDYLAQSLNLCVNNKKYINELSDTTNHLVSSKTSNIYNTIDYIKHIPGNGLGFDCINYYKGALEKSIRLL